MSVLLALFAAALCADPPQPPIRVVEASDTRLALEIRAMPPLADDLQAGDSTPRSIVFTRSAPDASWAVASGLSNGEVVGEPELRFPQDAGTVSIGLLGDTVGSVAGTGVTAIDLIEGDVALCIWQGGTIRAVHFANRLVPAAAEARRRATAVTPVVALLVASKPGGSPHVRAAIIAAQSRNAPYASAGRNRAAILAVTATGGGLMADLEACAAVLDYAQPGVEPKIDAQYLLYFGLMRVLEAPAVEPPSSG